MTLTLSITHLCGVFFGGVHKKTQLILMCHETKVWLQKDQWFRRYSRKSYFDYISLHSDFDLDDSKAAFGITLWLVVVHNHTKVCDTRFSGSEDLVQTNIH